jgi:hypothetical protein
MLGNRKALKRNDRERKGILIGPSFLPGHRDSRAVFFLNARKSPSAGVKSRGADGKPTTNFPQVGQC